jgi:hypothetical protein
MLKVSWRMTRCYYPSWKHSHSAFASYTLLEILGVFSLCAVVDLCHSHETSPAPRQTRPPLWVLSAGQPSVISSACQLSWCLRLFIPHVNFSDVSSLFVNCEWILAYPVWAWRLSNWFALWILFHACQLRRKSLAFPRLLWNSVYQLHFVLCAQYDGNCSSSDAAVAFRYKTGRPATCLWCTLCLEVLVLSFSDSYLIPYVA